MKRAIPHRTGGTLALGCALVFMACGVAKGQPAGAVQYPKTNLLTFIEKWDGTKGQSNLVCELSPEWVGTVKRVFLKGGEGIYQADEPKNIRFSHLRIGRLVGETNLVIFRGGGAGGTLNEMPAYARKLPSAKTVFEARNLDELQKLFGPQVNFTDGWGLGDRMHWTQGWTWFTVENPETLRYLNVFAHVSAAKGQKIADIDILNIEEGLFRRADPNSEAERKQFKSGAEMWAEYEAERAKAPNKYPEPLRALIAAREYLGDDTSKSFLPAMNEIRRHPQPELFRQLAERFDDGSSSIEVITEGLLLIDVDGSEKWQDGQRKVALRALTDALPAARTSMALEHLIVLLLRSQGGGELKFDVPETNAHIAIKVELKGEGVDGSHSESYGSSGVSGKNLAKVAEECRRVLKERYADLR